MNTYDLRYQRKQRMGQITTATGCEMEVFTTGMASWYLFCTMTPDGTTGDLAFAYHGNRLKRGWKKKIH